MLDVPARANGLRLIAVDRPGYGQTPFTWRHSFRTWGHTLAELAEVLNVEKFAVMGTSGGPAFVAACGLPNVVPAGSLKCLCFVAPEGPSAGLGLSVPDAVRPTLLFAVSLLARLVNLLIMPLWLSASFFFALAPDRMVVAVVRLMTLLVRLDPRRSETCKRVVADPVELVRHGLRTAMIEGLRQGILGTLYEGFLMYVLDWGFALEEVRCQKVLTFHGKADVDVLEYSAKCFERVPGCKATHFEREGHVSILVNQGDRICREVKAAFAKH